MKALKKITSIVLAFAMVVTLMAVSPATKADAAVKFMYGKKITLNVGKKDSIHVKGKAKFTSSNKKIATVTKKGVVKAKKPGICKITVKVGKSKAKSTITVLPNKVTLTSAALTSISSAKVTWKAQKNVTGYYVYSSTGTNGAYKKVATIKGAKKNSYSVSNLVAGGKYFYKVKAYVKAGKKNLTSTKFSNEMSVKTWKLVWNDEFEGTKLDATKWNNEGAKGAGGYGNNEVQNYQMDYCEVKNGNCIIKPQFDWNTTTQKVVQGSAYSTKLWTKGLYAVKYGKVEFRVKLPKGKGTWAAAWMLGEKNGWPLCGEIDVLETTSDPTKTFIPQTIHCKKFNGMPTSTGPKNKTTQVKDATSAYHTYGIEWDEERIKFTIDGKETWTYDPDKYKASGEGNGDIEMWPYNQPCYLILNCALGGNLGRDIGPDFWTKIATNGNIETYQDYYYIDWVRVSQ